eukprot:m.132822 g.132822  ORF g.132822 m.132822 type:complete len:66 (+) comp13940_c0_seq12:4484-4681(+)
MFVLFEFYFFRPPSVPCGRKGARDFIGVHVQIKHISLFVQLDVNHISTTPTCPLSVGNITICACL